jgi:RNA polymerase sigma-70 factor (ECF subfamily)
VLTEQESVARLKAGDIAGLESLVRRYQLPALRAAFGVTQQRELAEDVVHDAFLIVYERIDQFDDTRPFRPWFYRIVINLALRMTTRAAREQPMADELRTSFLQQSDPTQGPEEQALTGELRDVLRAALAVLTPAQRTVLVMRYYLQLDEREMAAVLGRPAGTVKWRLHAARRRLQAVLGAEHVEAAPEGT